MAVFAFASLLLGYSAAFYGYNRITGGNDTFKSLVWPGAYKPVARDSGAGGPTPPAASSTPTPTLPSAPQPPNYSPGLGGAIHP